MAAVNRVSQDVRQPDLSAVALCGFIQLFSNARSFGIHAFPDQLDRDLLTAWLQCPRL